MESIDSRGYMKGEYRLATIIQMKKMSVMAEGLAGLESGHFLQKKEYCF